MAAGKPANELEVAQASGRALYVRLQAVFRVCVFGVTRFLLLQFSAEEILRGPYMAGIGGPLDGFQKRPFAQ